MLFLIFLSLVFKFNSVVRVLRAPFDRHLLENLPKPTGTFVKIHDGGLLHSVNDDLLEIMIETSELNPKVSSPLTPPIVVN